MVLAGAKPGSGVCCRRQAMLPAGCSPHGSTRGSRPYARPHTRHSMYSASCRHTVQSLYTILKLAFIIFCLRQCHSRPVIVTKVLRPVVLTKICNNRESLKFKLSRLLQPTLEASCIYARNRAFGTIAILLAHTALEIS